jgi:hypothetical protein
MLKYHIKGMAYDEFSMTIFSRINRFPKNLVPCFETKDSDIDLILWLDDEILTCNEYSKYNYATLTESAAIVPQTYEKFANNFDSIIQNFNMIFTHSRELVNMHEKIKWIPATATWIQEPHVREKSKKISMITSTKNWAVGHKKRMELASSLSGKVDLYGRGINEIEFKEQGLDDYMFSIAHENANYPGYFTEKILDCFSTGTIPVYWGDPSIGEVFNTDGIILLDGKFDPEALTEDIYYSKMDAIKENCEIVKNNFMMVEDYIYDNYLKDLDDDLS